MELECFVRLYKGTIEIDRNKCLSNETIFEFNSIECFCLNALRHNFLFSVAFGTSGVRCLDFLHTKSSHIDKRQFYSYFFFSSHIVHVSSGRLVHTFAHVLVADIDQIYFPIYARLSQHTLQNVDLDRPLCMCLRTVHSQNCQRAIQRLRCAISIHWCKHNFFLLLTFVCNLCPTLSNVNVRSDGEERELATLLVNFVDSIFRCANCVLFGYLCYSHKKSTFARIYRR